MRQSSDRFEKEHSTVALLCSVGADAVRAAVDSVDTASGALTRGVVEEQEARIGRVSEKTRRAMLVPGMKSLGCCFEGFLLALERSDSKRILQLNRHQGADRNLCSLYVNERG